MAELARDAVDESLADSLEVIINFATFRKDRHALFDLRCGFAAKPYIVTDTVVIIRRINVRPLR